MASKPEPIRDKFRFGEGFELDLRAYELRRSGRVLKLEPTPMELLFLLVEHKGELITRDQIIERIWGKGVFLDTDNSINGAIRKIRQVLGDNPEQPRFVQTITGRGYRFIAPVIEPETKELQEQEADALRAATKADAVTGSGIARRWKVTVAAAVAVLAVALAGHFYSPRIPKLTDKDAIVLADFTNATSDPVFDLTLRQGMAVQLEQSPFLSLVSDQRIQQTLRLMGQSADARLTPEIAREICERTASAAVLEGSIASIGTQYVLALRAKDCRTGDVLDEEQVQVARKEDVLKALGEIATKFRTRVGESLSMVAKHDIPLPEATTSSLEALKAYSAGWKAIYAGGAAAALPFFKEAIEIDPRFASAYAALGRVYGDLGESALSAESTGRAYELRARTSDNEKFFISASYDMQVAGDLQRAQQTCALWAQAYPRATWPRGFLSGIIYPAFGKYEMSVEEAKTLTRMDPDFPNGYFILASSYVALERTDEAENTLRQAFERKLGIPELSGERYAIAFLKGDTAGMEREVAQARGKFGVEDSMSNLEGLALAYSGHLGEARKRSRQAADLARQAGRTETAALYETQAALREALFGNASAAWQKAIAALRLSRSRDVEFGAALALAFSGESNQSQRVVEDLSRRFPEDMAVRFTYAPTLRALLALNHGKSVDAIELLQTAIPYELGTTVRQPLFFPGSLYPAYVRGQVYLVTRRGQEAVVEFQKLLAHRGIVVSDPIGALAHLQLGRAFALSGDKTKAKTAYQDFLALWKDADLDIPILKQAQKEYAKLQ